LHCDIILNPQPTAWWHFVFHPAISNNYLRHTTNHSPGRKINDEWTTDVRSSYIYGISNCKIVETREVRVTQNWIEQRARSE